MENKEKPILTLHLQFKSGIVWKERTLYLFKDRFQLWVNTKLVVFKKLQFVEEKLRNAKIINTAKKLKVTLKLANNDKVKFLFEKEEDKQIFITKVTELVKEISKKEAFSSSYLESDSIIKSSSQLSDDKENIELVLKRFCNILKELGEKLKDLETFAFSSKVKSKEDQDYIKTLSGSLICVKEEIENQFDKISRILCLSRTESKDSLIQGLNNEDVNLSPTALSSVKINDQPQTDLELINAKTLKIDQISSEAQPEENQNEADRISKLTPYNQLKIRTGLKRKISFNSKLGKDFINILKANRGRLPIYYYEPLTNLQRLCEMFYNSSLLDKAATITDKTIQIIYVAAFLASSKVFKFSRVLKPLEPIIGETYEYIDPDNKFRFFSEQVCSEPPISAFIGDNKFWSVFGDDRHNEEFKLFKGGVTLEFESKTHIKFKNSSNYYVASSPKEVHKNFVVGKPLIDIVGESIITDAQDNNLVCEIVFKEETKKEIGYFEGKVQYKNQTKYLIKGNWTSYFCYYTSDGKDKTNVWNSDDEKFMHNNEDEYYLPSKSYNLNNLTEDMLKILPSTDSRYRPDLRLLEETVSDQVASMKKKLEKKETEVLEEYEKEKILYQPNYFSQVYESHSGDYVYTYKDTYWQDREQGNFEGMNEEIFNLN